MTEEEAKQHPYYDVPARQLREMAEAFRIEFAPGIQKHEIVMGIVEKFNEMKPFL